MKNTEPQSNCVSRAPASSGPAAEIAPPRPDHKAIERVRAGPDHRAVISASVVGKAMPAARPPTEASDEQDRHRRCQRRQQRRRDRERRAEHEHQLASIAVAERAEVEHRGGEPERVADRDQVEPGLGGVERLADVGQRDVGHRQVQVRDGGHRDQRREHGSGMVGGFSRGRRSHGRPAALAGLGRPWPGHLAGMSECDAKGSSSSSSPIAQPRLGAARPLRITPSR